MKSILCVTTAAIIAATAFMGCNKSNEESLPPYIPQPLLNKYDSTIETSSPVLKIDATDINANVASSYAALPALYDNTTKKYPLLIVMHGTEELGTQESELYKVLQVGIGKKIAQKTFPANTVAFGENNSFIVVLPQFKKWPTAQDVNSVIDYAISKYRVDSKRVYLTGVSMGGGLVWDASAELGSKVAAGVAFSSVTYIKEPGCKSIADNNVGLWVFHNNNDNVFPIAPINQYVDLVNKYEPRVAVRKTIWSADGHDSWTKGEDQSYRENGKNIYEWMLGFYR